MSLMCSSSALQILCFSGLVGAAGNATSLASTGQEIGAHFPASEHTHTSVSLASAAQKASLNNLYPHLTFS